MEEGVEAGMNAGLEAGMSALQLRMTRERIGLLLIP